MMCVFSYFVSILLLPEDQHHQHHSPDLVLPRYPHTRLRFQLSLVPSAPVVLLHGSWEL